MQIIPLQPVPSQTLAIVLNNQDCEISIHQKSTGLFFDLSSNGNVIVTSRYCANGVKIVRRPDSGFVGDFMFVDIEGKNQNPDYLGLGESFVLVYL
jgi:hypothetical protein